MGVESPTGGADLRGQAAAFLPIDDLYRYRGQEREAFQGEAGITAAILEVAEPVTEEDLFSGRSPELQPGRHRSELGHVGGAGSPAQRDFYIDTLDLAVGARFPTMLRS